jgi:tryptophan synthase
MGKLREAFEKQNGTGRPAFVAFITAGYPTMEATVPLMLGLQDGGADVIELGVPFTDPMADGATIQRTNEVALAHSPPVSLADCIAFVAAARAAGLTTPVVLMGYYNPLLAYGTKALMADSAKAGVDGFIVVDLPPEEGATFVTECRAHALAFVPLVTPASTDDRIAQLATVADGFLYCVSLTGVTGARSDLPAELPAFIARVRANSDVPLAVGFGVSSREHVAQIATFAEGVVVGSAVCKAAESAKSNEEIRPTVAAFVRSMLPDAAQIATAKTARASESHVAGAAAQKKARIDTTVKEGSHFGEFGGRYIPETLVEAHRELEEAYAKAKADPTFQAEVAEMRARYVGGPTPMYHAKRLTAECGGAQIWLKREELAHTGAHKINNAIGQALLALRLGKKRIIAETGAGQHGVATATVCALLGLECVVYMGAEVRARGTRLPTRVCVCGCSSGRARAQARGAEGA